MNLPIGTGDATAYKVKEIERHIHSPERWYGSDGDSTASTANNMTEFRCTAGTGGAFGTEVQLLAANDVLAADFDITPIYFDIHRIFITSLSATGTNYILQIWTGTTTFGASTLRTEIPFRAGAAITDIFPIICQMRRVGVTEKVWARVKSETNGATIDFLLGIHSYEV